MRSSLCFWAACIAVSAGAAWAQCSAAPAPFSATCAELQSSLDSFNSAIDSQWNGVKTPVAFGTDLTTANPNRGLATLLAPATLIGVQNQLNAFQLVGIQEVTLAVSFPILYQPFYQYNNDPQDYAKVLSFYQGVMAEARKRGMKVVIEAFVMFPNLATDLPLTAYYATLSAAQVTAGRAQVALTVAQQLQPDWINLGSEPDTQSALLGLASEFTPQEYATDIGTIVAQLRGAGISGKPLIGAGIGTWQANGSAYLQALLPTGVDFIDFHAYSVNLGYLAAAVQYIDMACAAGKGVALSEAWMKKVNGAQLQGKSEFAVIGVLSSDTTNSYDAFSFWSPLDTQFIQELAKLGYWKSLYYVSPFNGNYFYAYLDYNQVGSLPPAQILAQETTAATVAMRAGTLSATGQAYAALIRGSVTPLTVSAASGLAAVAPGSIVSIYGSNLAASSAQATSLPLPTTLGGASVTITDSSGAKTPLPLFYAAPQQINAEIPDGASTGPATLAIGGFTGAITLVAVAPGLFSANGDGKGVAAAQIVTAHAGGAQTAALAYQCMGGAGSCVPLPIDLGAATDQSALVLYGTGIRNRSALSDVTVTIGAQTLAVQYAGPAPAWVGLDQINVALPRSLAGSGTVSLRLSVAGLASNILSLAFR